MTLGDFEPKRSGSGRYDLWRAKRPLATPSFAFEVEVWSPPGQPPTEAALAQVNRLADLVGSRHADVLARIHEDYRNSAEDEEWMQSVGVPTGLAAEQLAPHFGPVTLSALPPGKLDGDLVISVNPAWDPEHGLDLWLDDGEFEEIEY
jgi:hypothetical protein